MESQKPKIAMYVKRPFGEKLNASFDFLKENWKLLLKFTTYLLLPLCLIQALSLNGLMSGALSISAIASSTAMAASSSSLIAFGSYYGLYMFLYLIGIILLTSLVYGLIRTYNEREERLQGVTLGMLKPRLFRNIKRLLLMTVCWYFCRSSGCFDAFHIVSDYSVYHSFLRTACSVGAHLFV